jgi:hypothetical protein
VNYGGSDVACRPGFGYESQLPFVILEDDLGLSAERFAELKAERPLLNWPEANWMNGLFVTAVLLAVLIGVWRWFRYRDEQVHQALIYSVLSTLLVSLLAYLILYIGTNMLVSFIFPGPNGPYWLSSVIGVIGAVLTLGWRWRVRNGWQPKFGRTADSLAGGTTIFMATYFFGFMMMLVLGFID